jgi:hypothetical protein
MDLDIRTVQARWLVEPDGRLFEVDVAIGDGSVEFGSDYEYDERVFFYFEDEEEYKLAKNGGSAVHGIEFEIVSEVL